MSPFFIETFVINFIWYKVAARKAQVFLKENYNILKRMNKTTQDFCWIITEGIAGTENQCIGVADALDVPYKVRRITLNEPWKSLSPYVALEQKWSFSPKIAPPWPKLLITSGRKSVAAARFIKKQSQGQTISVHIQDPKAAYSTFDLIAAPHHDGLETDNVFVTKASPNKITKSIINEAQYGAFDFSALPSPRVAVLIGGKSKAYDLTASDTQRITEDLRRINGSLMITCSRRTGTENTQILRDALQNDTTYFWDGTSPNPYFSMLKHADFIIVTADSASMISESCTTGKPVYMIDLKGGARRINTLHKTLIDLGCLRKFDGELTPYGYAPLQDAQDVADEIKTRFGTLLGLMDV